MAHGWVVRNGPPDPQTGLAALEWRAFPDPEPGPGEVRLRIAAAGVNRADLMQRQGRYPPPPGASEVLGLEASGVVEAVGEGVDRSWLGERVATLLPGGGYGTHVLAPASLLIRVWPSMDDVTAAALPEVFMTAYAAMFLEARIQPGETVLVHAAASGVGTAAIQLAKAIGCRVVTTCGGAEKAEACRQLGADLAIDRHQQDFGEAVLEAYPAPVRHVGPGGHNDVGPVDVIVDMVGADYFAANLRLLAVAGRMVFVAAQSGPWVDLSIYDLTAKRLQLLGTTLRARTPREKSLLKDALLAQFGEAFSTGTIAPVIDAVAPMSEFETLHQRMLSNANVGKLVLTVP